MHTMLVIFMLLTLFLAAVSFAREQQIMFAPWTYNGKCNVIKNVIIFRDICKYSLTDLQDKRWKCIDGHTLQCAGLRCPTKACGVRGSTRSMLTGYAVRVYSDTYAGGCRNAVPACSMSDGNGWVCVSRTTLQCTGMNCPAKACGAKRAGSHLAGYQVKPTAYMSASAGKYYGASCLTKSTTLYFKVINGNALKTCTFSAGDNYDNQWRCVTSSVLGCLGSACPETACGMRRV